MLKIFLIYIGIKIVLSIKIKVEKVEKKDKYELSLRQSHSAYAFESGSFFIVCFLWSIRSETREATYKKPIVWLDSAKSDETGPWVISC